MKKRTYSLLSIIGFVILFEECDSEMRSKGVIKDYSLWLKLCGKTFLWLGCMVLLPAVIISALLDRIAISSYILKNILEFIPLIYLYISGSIISLKLYDWKKVNISDVTTR